MFVTYKLQRVIAMATEQIRVDSEVLQRALKHRPKYLNITGFFSQLIDDAISAIDKGERMENERERVFSKDSYRDRDCKEKGISTETEKKVDEVIQKAKPLKKKSLTTYTKDFQKFWTVYLSSPKKSGNGGSKAEAFTEWKKAIQEETPEKLIKALVAHIEDQRAKELTDDSYPPLKHACGWLKKKDFSSWLDVVTVKQQVQKGIKVYG